MDKMEYPDNLSPEMRTAYINNCRSAFVLFKLKNIKAVKEQFPHCTEFVEKYKHLSIQEVSDMLSRES